MKEPLDSCPKCGAILDTREPLDAFYIEGRAISIKTKILFRDPDDGEIYCISKCGECSHTWDESSQN